MTLEQWKKQNTILSLSDSDHLVNKINVPNIITVPKMSILVIHLESCLTGFFYIVYFIYLFTVLNFYIPCYPDIGVILGITRLLKVQDCDGGKCSNPANNSRVKLGSTSEGHYSHFRPCWLKKTHIKSFHFELSEHETSMAIICWLPSEAPSRRVACGKHSPFHSPVTE